MKLDALLVVGYFRSATPFLSVIRHLAAGSCIGVLFVDTDASLKAKTGEAHELFVELCAQFGARIVRLGEPVQTRLMVVQQFVYADDVVARLRDSVHADSTIGMMTLASAGLAPHDAFVAQFGIGRAYCPDVGLVRFLLQRRGAEQRYRGVILQEVGLPFCSHPVFPEFEVDWLFAAPTTFSFFSEAGKLRFLLTVSELLEKIPAGSRVAYKPHNGHMLDYFAPRLYYPLGRALSALPLMFRAARWLSRRPVAQHITALTKLLAAILHVGIVRRAVPMHALTRYADISVEAFLPGVREGVIGGLSNVIWGASRTGLRYLNCIDPEDRRGTTQLKPGAAVPLDLNLEYFGVPYCNGELGDGAEACARSAGNRTVDLVDAVREDLAEPSRSPRYGAP